MENINKLVENDCKGNVDPKNISRNKYLKASLEINKLLESLNFKGNLRYMRVRVEMLKILGEETDDK